MDDWPDEPREPPSRPTLRPVFVAVLIVVACIALAVRTLQNMNTPVATAPADEARHETPRPAATVRKQRTAAVATPRPTGVAPTATPSHSPTPVPTATPAPVPTPTPTLRPSPAPTAPSKPHEEASLVAVAPPKLKRGGPTVLDVRGRGLRPDHRVIVLRGGRVPPEIGVPRQKLIDASLIQVLIVVDAKAPKGEYDVAVADGEGRRSNRVHFEVLP